MSPVIRIDNEVMVELKKRAIGLGLVFEPPNATLRIALGLDSQVAFHPEEEYVIQGEIYCSQGRTWEIGRFERPGRHLLPFDKYPFVQRKGTDITLVIGGKEYPAHFHHYDGGGGYIGGSTRNAPPIKDILANHGLEKHKTPVTLRFRGDKVYLER